MSKLGFLLDVLACSLSSFGGPEAHYGVFSSLLVQKKRYLNEETLSELIGVFSLVPGPSSTQTITAIGYLVGGPWLAFLTFIVWALPAMVIMTIIGVLFTSFQTNPLLTSMLQFLPAIALGFIAFA
ncbi:MAG: chromate transporter, partial [Bacilli bacterium]